MKLILSAILGGLVLFIGGWLLYGVIYMALFPNAATEPTLWKIALGCLTQALFMGVIYPHGYKGGSPAGEGFKFGIWIGLLLSIPYFFYMWSEPEPLAARALLLDAFFMGVLAVLAGIVIGLVYGKKPEPAATS
jgi:hypothetical protein